MDVAGPDTSSALLRFGVWEGINSVGATTHGVRHLYSSLRQTVHICQLNNFVKTLVLKGYKDESNMQQYMNKNMTIGVRRFFT